MNRKFQAVAVVLVLWANCGLRASDPGWWDAYNVIDTNLTENNYGPVNLGQLKHIAIQARLNLEAELQSVGGAGQDIDDVIDPFYDFNQNQPIVDPNIDHYAPINLGQLKHVAKPFYDRLDDVGYDTVANLQARSGYGVGWTDIYPWDPSTPVADNYAPVTIGQLKMVFSFDLAGFTPPGGGLSFEDWVEFHFPTKSGQPGYGWDDEPGNTIEVQHETYGLTFGDAYLMNVDPTVETMGLHFYSVR